MYLVAVNVLPPLREKQHILDGSDPLAGLEGHFKAGVREGQGKEERKIGKEGKRWMDIRKGRKAPPSEINILLLRSCRCLCSKTSGIVDG